MLGKERVGDVDATFAIVFNHVLVAVCRLVIVTVVTRNAMKVAGARFQVQRRHPRKNQRSHVAAHAAARVVQDHVVITYIIITIIAAVLVATVVIAAIAVIAARVVAIAVTVKDLKDPSRRL